MCRVQNEVEHATTVARAVKRLEKIQGSTSGPLKRDESSDLGSYNVDKLMCDLKLSSCRGNRRRRSGGSDTYKPDGFFKHFFFPHTIRSSGRRRVRREYAKTLL